MIGILFCLVKLLRVSSYRQALRRALRDDVQKKFVREIVSVGAPEADNTYAKMWCDFVLMAMRVDSGIRSADSGEVDDIDDIDLDVDLDAARDARSADAPDLGRADGRRHGCRTRGGRQMN